MSEATAPLRGVGVWAAPGTASTPPLAATRGSPSAAELEVFKRAVRPSWWRALWPLYTTAALGAAVLLVASEAPAPITVRRMLTPAAPPAHTMVEPAPAVRHEYQLPAHWQAALAPPGLVCDPLSAGGC